MVDWCGQKNQSPYSSPEDEDEDVGLVDLMYLVYLPACQAMGVTVKVQVSVVVSLVCNALLIGFICCFPSP